MTPPEQLWRQLEGQPADGPLSYLPLRDTDAAGSACLLAGLRRGPDGTPTRLLLLRLPVALVQGAADLGEYRGLRLERIRDKAPHGATAFVSLVLTEDDLSDIFGVLADDLRRAIEPAPTPAASLTAFLERLNRWRDLFSRLGGAGLSAEERRGLFGELWTLRWLLDATALPARQVLAAWGGPDGRPQDFHFGTAALEVKTSTGGSRTLRISSARQLDVTTAGCPIFLLQVPLVPQGAGAETLPVLVAALDGRLAADPEVAALFTHRLTTAGYRRAQADLYAADAWATQLPVCFAVTEGFPCLSGSALNVAITALTYDLNASALGPWHCPDSAFLSLLT